MRQEGTTTTTTTTITTTTATTTAAAAPATAEAAAAAESTRPPRTHQAQIALEIAPCAATQHGSRVADVALGIGSCHKGHEDRGTTAAQVVGTEKKKKAPSTSV